MARPTAEMRSWAKVGAEQRLQQIDAEQRAIVAAFPELRRGAVRAQPAGSEQVPSRRRRRMSAAQKKALSERMKKIWAERRKKDT